MLDVTTMYGPQGPDTVGDSHVADILKRSVEAQPTATLALDTRLANLLRARSLVTDDLSIMAAAHSEWVAAILWQAATCYLDGTMQSFAHDATASFATLAYPGGDALCDTAAEWSRKATHTRSQIQNGTKVRLTQAAQLPSLPVNAYTLKGVWAVYDMITRQVHDDVTLFAAKGAIPTRYQALYRELTHQVRPHIDVMAELCKDFKATTILQNNLEILAEASRHMQVIFESGQQLWAPYLLGAKYTEAKRRQLSLEELGLGFDPWIMTDPLLRKQYEKDLTKRDELAQFWSSVSDVESLRQLAEQVNTLRRQDVLRRRYGRGYPMVPWPSQFMVRRASTIGGRAFAPGDLIGYFVRQQGANSIQVDIRKTGRAVGPLQLLGVIEG